MEEKVMMIRCMQSTKKKLREFQVHHRETDEDIILRMIQGCKHIEIPTALDLDKKNKGVKKK